MSDLRWKHRRRKQSACQCGPPGVRRGALAQHDLSGAKESSSEHGGPPGRILVYVFFFVAGLVSHVGTNRDRMSTREAFPLATPEEEFQANVGAFIFGIATSEGDERSK